MRIKQTNDFDVEMDDKKTPSKHSAHQKSVLCSEGAAMGRQLTSVNCQPVYSIGNFSITF